MDLDVEESSSIGEDELFDIDWSSNEADSAFSYVDPLTVSALFSVVIKGDVESIKNLLKSGRSVNNNDNLGNTPLHVSVITACKASFDFLITVEDIRLDAQNFKGETPLISATKSSNKDREYFALNLIESGANTEVMDFDEKVPLHYASTYSFDVTKKLIDSGANVNVFNDSYGTPLMSAIESCQTEIVYLLAFGGTDMELVREDKNTVFTLSLLLPDRNLQEFLFDCSFDRHYKQSVALNVFNKVLLSSGDFHEIFLNYFYECTSDFIYDEEDIVELTNILARVVEFEDFKAFFTNFPEIFKVLFSYSPNFLFDLVGSRCDANEKSLRVLDYLNLIFSSEFVEDFIKCSGELGNIICKLVRISKLNNHSLETLTELVKLMLSYGIEVNLYDLNSVYENYGVGCELFQFLLLMSIDLSYSDWHYGNNMNFLCLLMVDLNLCLEKSFNEIHLYYLSLRYSLGMILDYFAGEQLKIFTLMYHQDEDILDKPALMQDVQSLRELSREASRKCLIEKFNIRNSMQFYSCLRKLPVNQIYKDIISYQRGIYY